LVRGLPKDIGGYYGTPEAISLSRFYIHPSYVELG
jgi:hypothetical protein